MSKRVMNFAGDNLPSIGLNTTACFNTFRSGDKWGNLDLLEEIDLTFNRNLIGSAVANNIFSGNLEAMLKIHAQHYHGVVHLIPSYRIDTLSFILESIYGGVLDRDNITVVYLTRKFMP